MKLLRNLSILFYFLVFICFSCANESNENDSNDTPTVELPENVSEMILGKWIITEGYRNGTPTETLADTFFEFSDDGQMSTNLGGTNEVVEYKVEGKSISHNSERFQVDYSIENITDSLLMLSMTLREIPFVLVLNRPIE